MRFLIVTLIVAVATFVIQLVLPWWSLGLVAFIVGYLSNLSGWGAFGAGLLGAGGTWFIYAMWLNMANESLLASKIGVLFSVPEPLLLVLIAALMAGLVGAFACASGSNLRDVLGRKEAV